MKTIWKYELENDSVNEFELPLDSKTLTIQKQNDKLNIWIELDSDKPKKIIKQFFPISLNIESYQELELPENSKIISVYIKNNLPYIWIETEKNIKKDILRKLGLIPTGETIKSKSNNYIGTVQYKDGKFVQHLFEILDKDYHPKLNNNVKLIDQVFFHKQFIEVVKNISNSSKKKFWVAFNNCTFILHENSIDLNMKSIETMKHYGKVFAGAAAGDFTVHKLNDDEGYIVSGHCEGMYTYVNPKEKKIIGLEDLGIGLYGRMKRDIDANELNIIATSNEFYTK